jgi:predicted kinase
MSSILLNFDTLADDNIRTLKVPAPSFRKPLIIIFVGIPASGKTTLTEKLAEKFPLTVLSEENMTAFLSPRATIFKRNSEEVFKLAVKTIERLVKLGKACIYDANVKRREQRGLIRQTVEESGGLYLLIYTNCPRESCYGRLQKQNLAVERGEEKGFILDKDYFEFEASSTKPPSPEELHLTYNCENPESSYQILPLIEKRLSEGKN